MKKSILLFISFHKYYIIVEKRKPKKRHSKPPMFGPVFLRLFCVCNQSLVFLKKEKKKNKNGAGWCIAEATMFPPHSLPAPPGPCPLTDMAFLKVVGSSQ